MFTRRESSGTLGEEKRPAAAAAELSGSSFVMADRISNFISAHLMRRRPGSRSNVEKLCPRMFCHSSTMSNRYVLSSALRKKPLQYRVSHVLVDLCWVDFHLNVPPILLSCPVASAKFPSAQTELMDS